MGKMVKISALACALLVGNAAAYSTFVPKRNSISTLGQSKRVLRPSQGNRHVGASIKMEDFGLLKGSGFSFDELWGDNESISEVGLEKNLNKTGIRYKMNRTAQEADEVGRLYDLPGLTVSLPFIGETYLGPPKVASIWEAMGFTATSNNEARQELKKAAVEKARIAKVGVKGGEGAGLRGNGLRNTDTLVLWDLVESFMLTNFRQTKNQWVVSTWENQERCGLCQRL